MAYPTVDGPYGFLPINLIGGQVFAGATRQIPITTGSATSIYFGDLVCLNTGGTLTRVSSTDSAADVVGVFMGCAFTNPTTKQFLQQQYYPASTSASDIIAYVADDPDGLFKVAVLSNSTTIGGMTQTDIGNNVAMLTTAGSTTTGDSKEGVSATTSASVTTLPFRVIAGIPETVNAAGSFTEVIVKINFGIHTYYSPTPVVTAA
jgi:hypothetical protein